MIEALSFDFVVAAEEGVLTTNHAAEALAGAGVRDSVAGHDPAELLMLEDR